VLHLLFNMIALWNVGGFMERLLGSTGFLVLYLLAGLLGSVARARSHVSGQDVKREGRRS
jgi:membrane associated rhomboid family serine protease